MSKIGNKSKLYISENPSNATPTWTQILGAINITPPAQDRNAVDLPVLDQEDDLMQRTLGSRNGGDLAFSVGEVASDTGFAALQDALESGDVVGFKIVGSDSKNVSYLNCEVQKVAEGERSTDGRVTFECGAIVNSLGVAGTEA